MITRFFCRSAAFVSAFLLLMPVVGGSYARAQTALDWLEKWPKPAKTLRYDDAVYENAIRTVLLYPKGNMQGSEVQVPIVTLGGQLMLEFDDLLAEPYTFVAEIIHCNSDWKPSQLRSTEYLSQYNEFNINQFDYSSGTKVPYIHYRFEVPRVRVSGNYLLKVYASGDPTDLILTRRFMVTENTVNIAAQISPVLGSADGAAWQQVAFSVHYGQAKIELPQQSVFATIRQNTRWDNAITELKPLFIKDFNQELDFRYFDKENAFLGGNEFRILSFPSFGGGIGVKITQMQPDMNHVWMTPEKTRADRAFNSQRVINDLNGRFWPRLQVGLPATDADYALVHFFLETPRQKQEVYVVGGFNDWKITAENKLRYDEAQGGYVGELLLKQGQHDYLYALHDPAGNTLNTSFFEGDFSQTLNEYEVIVYYRPPGGRGDRIIGYWKKGG